MWLYDAVLKGEWPLDECKTLSTFKNRLFVGVVTWRCAHHHLQFCSYDKGLDIYARCVFKNLLATCCGIYWNFLWTGTLGEPRYWTIYSVDSIWSNRVSFQRRDPACFERGYFSCSCYRFRYDVRQFTSFEVKRSTRKNLIKFVPGSRVRLDDMRPKADSELDESGYSERIRGTAEAAVEHGFSKRYEAGYKLQHTPANHPAGKLRPTATKAHAELTTLSTRGNQLAKAGRHREAITIY